MTAPAPGAVPFVYSDPIGFYTHVFAPTFQRYLEDVDRFTWCRQWWKHREAVDVMTALWWSWEGHQPSPPPSQPDSRYMEWFLYHAWPALERLGDGKGPFYGCSRRTGHAPQTSSLLHEEDPTGRYEVESW